MNIWIAVFQEKGIWARKALDPTRIEIEQQLISS